MEKKIEGRVHIQRGQTPVGYQLSKIKSEHKQSMQEHLSHYYQRKKSFAWGLVTFLKRTGEGPMFELHDNFHRSYDHEDGV